MICHDSRSITTSASSSEIAFDTTPDNVQVNARWAPITSLFRRLTSAPVRVRMKNATGIFCTCENTVRRRSRISPSPIRADSHRSPIEITACPRATSAIATASVTIVADEPSFTISFTTWPASTGVATVSTAPTTENMRNHTSLRRCGRAKAAIRRSVAAEIGRRG